jgi:hypothetical protein
MRTFIKRSVVAAGFVAAVSGVAFAAEGNRQQADIPFAFVVNGQTLPAGVYSIERPRDMESSVVMIQGEGRNHASVYALVTPAPTTKGEDALVFAKTGTQMRLAQVGGWSLTD